MPKATLTFTLPEEQNEFETATKAGDFHSALWEISQEIFRPARKHGYPDQRIEQLVDVLNKTEVQAHDCDMLVGGGTELISLLEKKFYDILSERNIDL